MYFFTYANMLLHMKIPQYSTEYSEYTRLLDETSFDLVDNDTSASRFKDSDGNGTERGKEAMVETQRKISDPSGLLVG